MKIRHFLAAAAATLLVSTTAQAADLFTLSSSAFKSGTMLAKKNAGNNKQNPNCVGDNISPPLSWANPPAGTASYAFIVVDPEARGAQGVDHWIAYGIPASVTGFAEGEVSKASDKYVGGKNVANVGNYFGPCTPPNTTPHQYVFMLLATDLDPKALAPGLSRTELIEKLGGHVKGSSSIVGLFKNPL
jgi:Raf kinase inhibitor-like YbhB/YbcL family protein